MRTVSGWNQARSLWLPRNQRAPAKEMVRDQMALSFSWIARAGVCLIALLLAGVAARADEVLDHSGFEFPNGATPAKWKALQSAIEEEQEVVTNCRSDLATCPSATARRLVAIADEGTQYDDDRVRIAHINRAANLAIRRTKKYVDEWTSPLETLANGFGDCKQYAILKYVALHQAGYGVDRLRILVVENKMMPGSHAVVAVRSGGQWIVLDNLSHVLIEETEFLKLYRRAVVLPPLLRAPDQQQHEWQEVASIF